jgi:glycosyltransferase involved in cell wall biosynthesis
MKKRVLVEGPVLSQSGYGEHARFVLRSLRAQEDVFDIYALPLNWGQTSWLFEDNEERNWLDSTINKTVLYLQQQGQFDIYCHVGIPNELKRKAPITIEITAGIETNKVSPEWIDICNRECDKIITVSQHSKEVFENTSWKVQDQFGRQLDLKLNVPVEVVGYPVKEFNRYTDEKAREVFPLDYDFNFLCVAQWGPRKNLPNTIRWFLEEFKNDKVGLVCKVNHANNSLLDKESCKNALQQILKEFPNTKCKVYLLHGDMTNDEIHNLYYHPQIKAIVNFGHGEGFGLPLFEAAYCGLPVVAPDYSGHKDFLYMEVDGKKKAMFLKVPHDMGKIQKEAVWNGVLHPESEWAFVKPFGAKVAMREVYKDHGRFKGQAKKLKDCLLLNKDNKFEKLVNTILGKVYVEPQDFDGISFCIPTNGKRSEKTKLLLNSIRKQVGKPFEIIMCGDIENFRDEKDIIFIDEKDAAHSRKVALLRNKAADKSKYDVIAWCDDDIVLDNNWLKNTIEYSNNNGWNVLGNIVLNPDGTRYWDRATLSPQHCLIDYSILDDTGVYQSSAFFLVRKEVWDNVKWDDTKLVYDDSYEGIPEDVQYSIDLKKDKYHFHFNHCALAWHNDNKYTQWGKQTLRKDVIEQRFNIAIFPEACKEFIQILEDNK